MSRAAVTDSERRRDLRKSVAWRARIALGTGQFADAKIVDVAMGGCALTCQHTLHQGAKLELQIAAPDPHDHAKITPLRLLCEVAYVSMGSHGTRVGVQFLKLDGPAKNLIEAWVKMAS